MTIDFYPSPVGCLKICVSHGKLVYCDWFSSDNDRKNIAVRCLQSDSVSQVGNEDKNNDSMIIRTVISQLDDYFTGKITEFNIPLKTTGTEFQKKVWTELQTVPYGEAISYSCLAQRIGNPKAVRAVASACRANGISIFIPCHRIVGADGSLTGYAGGLEAKSFIIDLERKVKAKI